jgi:colicin import membrane protein
MIPAMTPVRELETRALTLAEEARALAVTDQQSYNAAAERLLAVVSLRREIEQHHAPLKKSAHDAWQKVIAAEKRLLDPVVDAERIYKTGIASYEAEQRRLEAEARAKAEAEARLAAEEARERELEQAESEGADAEEVAAIANAPLPMVAPAPVQPAFQPTRGVTTAANWKGEVTSLGALVKAIAQGQATVNLVTPNEVAINQLARATRGTLEVPGIKFYSTTTVRAGRR